MHFLDARGWGGVQLGGGAARGLGALPRRVALGPEPERIDALLRKAAG